MSAEVIGSIERIGISEAKVMEFLPKVQDAFRGEPNIQGSVLSIPLYEPIDPPNRRYAMLVAWKIPLQPDTSDEEMQRLAGKMPATIPCEIPLVFTEEVENTQEEKQRTGLRFHTQIRRVYYRAAFQPLELNPQTMEPLRDKVQSGERSEYNDPNLSHLEFARWLAKTGRVNEGNTQVSKEFQDITIADLTQEELEEPDFSNMV